MKRILVVVFATLALVLGLSGPASGAANPQHASCQAQVNSGFAGVPGGRALELQDAFAEAADLGVPVGAVLSEFSQAEDCNP
jgi:hypothetical protein